MNGIENYPAAGEFFLENVILKVSQTHFSKDFYPKGGGGGINFSRGGGVKYPEVSSTAALALYYQGTSRFLAVAKGGILKSRRGIPIFYK